MTFICYIWRNSTSINKLCDSFRILRNSFQINRPQSCQTMGLSFWIWQHFYCKANKLLWKLVVIIIKVSKSFQFSCRFSKIWILTFDITRSQSACYWGVWILKSKQTKKKIFKMQKLIIHQLLKRTSLRIFYNIKRKPLWPNVKSKTIQKIQRILLSNNKWSIYFCM